MSLDLFTWAKTRISLSLNVTDTRHRIFQRQIHLPQTRSTMRFLVVVATILAALWQTDALGTLSCRLIAYSVGCSPATVAHERSGGCSVSVHRRILTRFSLSAPLLLSPLRIRSRRPKVSCAERAYALLIEGWAYQLSWRFRWPAGACEIRSQCTVAPWQRPGPVARERAWHVWF